jgi:hypothetical protein
MNNNKNIKIYYTILLLVLGVKVAATIFSGGLSVHHGKKIAQLQVQKNNLLEQQMRLNSDFSNKSSLSSIATEYDLANYISISKPLVLNSSTTVASN